MRIGDMMSRDGKVFIRSENEPFDSWPALSFSRKAVAERLMREFVPGEDIMVHVETLSDSTPNPKHRGRILSAVVVDVAELFATDELIDPDRLRQAQAGNPRKWMFSLGALQAANTIGPDLPDAGCVLPEARRRIGLHQGSYMEVEGRERLTLIELPVRTLDLARCEINGGRQHISES